MDLLDISKLAELMKPKDEDSESDDDMKVMKCTKFDCMKQKSMKMQYARLKFLQISVSFPFCKHVCTGDFSRMVCHIQVRTIIGNLSFNPLITFYSHRSPWRGMDRETLVDKRKLKPVRVRYFVVLKVLKAIEFPTIENDQRNYCYIQ